MSSRLGNHQKDFEQQISCKWCGSESEVLYHDLQDRLGSTPGQWRLLRCLNLKCGLHWLDPIPTDEDLQEAYRAYYTHPKTSPGEPIGFHTLVRTMCKFMARSYQHERFGYDVSINPILSKTLSVMPNLNRLIKARLDFSVMYLDAKDRGSVLDVGCGNGLFLAEMRDQGWDTYGCDVDSKAAEAASSKGLAVSIGTLEEQAYKGDFFNAVTLSHVIEHLRDPLRTLKECFRVLKPGGKLIVVTPNVRSQTHIRFGRAWVHLDPPRHLYLFSPQLLAKVMANTGFNRLALFTTLRETDRSFTRSRAIQKSGRFNLFDRPRLPGRVISGIYALAHGRMLERDPECGEEIVYMGTKEGEQV